MLNGLVLNMCVIEMYFFFLIFYCIPVAGCPNGLWGCMEVATVLSGNRTIDVNFRFNIMIN